MSEVTTGYHPELTKERAMEIFQKHYKGKHRVRKCDRRSGFLYTNINFMVDMNTWFGVYVKLQQHKGKTSFWFHADLRPSIEAVPATVALMSFIFSIFWLIAVGTVTIAVIAGPVLLVAWIAIKVSLRPTRKKLEAEVKTLIENAPEFK